MLFYGREQREPQVYLLLLLPVARASVPFRSLPEFLGKYMCGCGALSVSAGLLLGSCHSPSERTAASGSWEATPSSQPASPPQCGWATRSWCWWDKEAAANQAVMKEVTSMLWDWLAMEQEVQVRLVNSLDSVAQALASRLVQPSTPLPEWLAAAPPQPALQHPPSPKAPSW